MKPTLFAILSAILFSSITFASTSYDVSVEKKLNYNNWGAAWDTVVVMKNNIITLAAVPKLGGRVMQYDLGTHPELYIKPDVIGKEVTSGYTLIGGFRQLPSPQSDFSWPAPDSLDFGQYKCTIRLNTADSCVVYLQSPIENSTDSKYSTHVGLQYKRTLTMYKASSRVKVEMVMVNTSSTPNTHGIWDITQVIAENQNTWIYFPLNPQSALGEQKYIQLQGYDTTQWYKDIVPGIMGVEYQALGGDKIGADSKGGWICYVDKADGYAFVKTFKYKEGKTYPDSSSSVQVYTYDDPLVLEVEVLGPLTSLAQNKSDTLIENWYAARSQGPIYSVTSAGLVTKPLTANPIGNNVKVKGTYGVFYTGKVRAIFKGSGAEVAADSYAVSPNDSFVLSDTLTPGANMTKVVLALYSTGGQLMGTLDSTAITPVAGGPNMNGKNVNSPLSLTRKGNVLFIDAPYQGDYRIDLTSLDGRQLLSLKGQKPMTYSLPMSKISAGVICVRMHHAGAAETKRVFVK